MKNSALSSSGKNCYKGRKDQSIYDSPCMLNELYVSEKIACLSPPYDESIPYLVFGVDIIKFSFEFDDAPKLDIFSFGVIGCFENSYLVLGQVENHVAIR